MTEQKRRGFTSRDLDGYELEAMPPVLPPYLGKPPSPKAAVRALVDKIYNTDADFRIRVGSVTNANAQTQSVHADKALAAKRIYDQAVEDEITAITSLGHTAIGKMVKSWLPAVMKERGLGRQDRIARAIQAGQLKSE